MATNRCISITYNGNTIKSIGYSKNLEIIPDDRQEIIKTVTSSGTPSVAVVDYGVVDDGQIISFAAVFSSLDYDTLVYYWSHRTKVTVRLDDGTIVNNARLVIKRTQYYDDLINNFKLVQLEVWRV